MSFRYLFPTVGLFAAGLMLGCPESPQVTDSPPVAEGDDHDHDHGGEGHAHPSEGPHHGDLIELGNEEYHAELVHTEEAVTIYILDGAAKTAVSIDAAEVVINALVDDEPKQYQLTAAPQEGDGEGKASRFELKDSALVQALESESSAPKLNVTINGTPFTGRIEHHHDHEGHDHQ